jgi:hypothetical protein
MVNLAYSQSHHMVYGHLPGPDWKYNDRNNSDDANYLYTLSNSSKLYLKIEFLSHRKCAVFIMNMHQLMLLWEIITLKAKNHTIWSWALLEKWPVAQLLQNSPTFYGPQRFIIMFTEALHQSYPLTVVQNPYIYHCEKCSFFFIFKAGGMYSNRCVLNGWTIKGKAALMKWLGCRDCLMWMC